MNNEVCCRAMVSGVVQGVGFRYFTREKAQSLGVTGYAKNLPSGCVEVVACGEPQQVDKLMKWLEDGPRTARVMAVSVETIPIQEFSGFGAF